MTIGQRVRFTGTAAEDIFHGALVGRGGVIVTLYPFVGVDFDGDRSAYPVAEKAITAVATAI